MLNNWLLDMLVLGVIIDERAFGGIYRPVDINISLLSIYIIPSTLFPISSLHSFEQLQSWDTRMFMFRYTRMDLPIKQKLYSEYSML
jgi:hypothetical protein